MSLDPIAPPTVLLVEDDPALRHTLSDALRVEGYRVTPSASVADARALWRGWPAAGGPDVVVLDLGLPDGEGESLLRAWQHPERPAMLVISARPETELKVRLLDQGADDYLVKPFSVAELLARMRVALRHRGRGGHAAVTHHCHQGLEIDLAHRRVSRDGQILHLSPTEFDLLACLLRSRGRVLTHRQLLNVVWAKVPGTGVHTLRQTMSQLRSKLETVPAVPEHLLTEPGVGYRLAEGDAGVQEAGGGAAAPSGPGCISPAP